MAEIQKISNRPEFRLSFDTAQNLMEEAEDLAYAGSYAKAMQKLERALNLTKAQAPRNYRDLVYIQNTIADSSIVLGAWENASNALHRSLEICEGHMRKDDPAVGSTALSLCALCMLQGQFSQASNYCRQSLDIFAHHYGEKSLPFAMSAYHLGIFLQGHNNDEAMASLITSEQIIKTHLGEEHPIFANVLLAEADIFIEKADHEQAQKLAQKALEIQERVLGRENPATALSLLCLARIRMFIGDFQKAERLCNGGLNVLEKAFGPDHPAIALFLDMLNDIYKSREEYARSLPILNRSIRIKEKYFGPDHLHTASSYAEVSDLQRMAGNYETALKASLKCCLIRMQVLGTNHVVVADAFRRVGSIYLEMKDFGNAYAFFDLSLKIGESVLGKNNVASAYSLSWIGELQRRIGRNDLSIPNFEQSLYCLDKALGHDHQNVITLRLHLASVYMKQARTIEAINQLRASLHGERNYYVSQFTTRHRKHSLLMVQKMFKMMEIFLSVTISDIEIERECAISNAEVLGWNKGLIEEMDRTWAGLQVPGKQLLCQRRWSALEQLNRLEPLESASGERSPLLQEIRKELEEIETKLAECDDKVAQMVSEQKSAFLDIARSIPRQSLLVDLVRYTRFDYFDKTNEWKEPRYAAYLTFPIPKDSTNVMVQRVDLGEAEPIDQAVQTICRRMAAGQYRAGDLSTQLRRVSELIYAPLAKYLTNATHLIICPDGQLSRLPFEMLPLPPFGPQTKYVIEEKTISYVGSGREIFRLAQPPTKSKRNGAVVMGNPDFDLDLTKNENWLAGKTNRSGVSDQVSDTNSANAEIPLVMSSADSQMQMLSRSYRGLKLSPLKGAEEEARKVAKLLGADCQLRLGTDARETELKKLASPRVLHLATHGFFLNDQEFRRTNLFADSFLSDAPAKRFPGESDWENPMIRCGIALAGANHATRITNALAEDGLLTGLEASLLNLQGTELVILSACDSGAGDIRIGEGVMSLRRAFRIAGAETVLASHWKVSDKATSQLMTEFIRRWRSGETRINAWREAQLSLLRSKEFSNPFFWSAFTLTGQWR